MSRVLDISKKAIWALGVNKIYKINKSHFQ